MYILEGNISVGKTTFLTLLKKHCPELEILTEPVDDWSKQVHGQSLLENFYQDISRWAYTLETFTMICRVRDHIREQANPNPNRILERSIYSGHYCFATNCYESGFLSDIEWKIYSEWADFLIHKHCNPPRGFIYLQSDPHICFARMKKRNRTSEKALTLEYLISLEHRHNQFLIEKQNISPMLKNVPVLILNCNTDFVDNPATMKAHAEKVMTFLKETQTNHTPTKPRMVQKQG